MSELTQKDINDFAAKLYAHIGHFDYVIASVGVRGPNLDMPSGNVLATVRMGSDEATAEAKYLNDAVTLARGIILRKREADAAKKEKESRKSHEADRAFKEAGL